MTAFEDGVEGEIELRQLFELEDGRFGPSPAIDDVQKIAGRGITQAQRRSQCN